MNIESLKFECCPVLLSESEARGMRKKLEVLGRRVRTGDQGEASAKRAGEDWFSDESREVRSDCCIYSVPASFEHSSARSSRSRVTGGHGSVGCDMRGGLSRYVVRLCHVRFI